MITGSDITMMVNHWLRTPANSYLGSNYGSDIQSLLQRPLSDSSLANEFIRKLINDVPLLKILPNNSINLYAKATSPDKLEFVLDIAGNLIQISGI